MTLVGRVSGTAAERPVFPQSKELWRPGKTLVVWRLDRLGRSIKEVRGWMHG
jgi:DNA invertase Pin-like site-specific DNA recombinase